MTDWSKRFWVEYPEQSGDTKPIEWIMETYQPVIDRAARMGVNIEDCLPAKIAKSLGQVQIVAQFMIWEIEQLEIFYEYEGSQADDLGIPHDYPEDPQP
jgi:hypothetical protein